ncbi:MULTISPECIES: hypothetical protein [Okeania]|uniref:Uncharacterized protein n=1 Tax=Okeania hirsuta TaxID=1458930 RepID=A0A3N6NRX1_9CYAN|nr:MULTISPECIES: hypothetical protein [Okeania]NEQ78280.1 hypothetical protein [Okeania sp. SIO2C9]NES79663.1 hypothetical protein [Okeania sp. SIO1H4]NES91802.1 hypothetical protein [Okeania sp. SIO2B9]NET23320.1 hypothetical protein [Okeania sp. SIO1H5]NET80048.1 hypothetical protein [Okeania sp. SIO1F9]
MKIKTQLHTEAVKIALLSLSEMELYNTIHNWLERISQKDWEAELLDEMQFALGYELESGETLQSYRSWDELMYCEPDCEDVYLIAPSPLKLHRYIEQMDSHSFYHNIIYIAGKAYSEGEMGYPPNAFCDGYQFMENLVASLRKNQPCQEKNYPSEIFRIVNQTPNNEQFFQVSEHWRTYNGDQVTDFVLLTSN